MALRLVTALLCFIWLHSFAHATEYVFVSGGSFKSVVPVSEGNNDIDIDDFYIRQAPVTNAEFLRFVLFQPDWQRSRAIELFVDSQYLANWSSDISLSSEMTKEQPVTQVSWFAAKAFCDSENARLPTWYEWEYVAAADATHPDARHQEAWRQKILSWYSELGGKVLAEVKSRAPNYYNVFDAHGLVWEWTDDYNALLVSADNREQGGADQLQFCGAGAITLEEKENYAVLMRVAMLSALEAHFTTRNLGFRCARSKEER